MIRSKDFYMKSVYNVAGKKLGIVEDLFINFFEGKVVGLKISNYSLFSKRIYIKSEDIVAMDKMIIANKNIVNEGLEFKEIKGMDIKDRTGIIRGVLEDVIINEEDYTIKGLVVSTGIIERLIKGKEILLINECILAEEYILYLGQNEITLKSMPRKVEKI
ncbi:MAG: PRC-barrel domain-containing protein [Clostridium sp.]|uniref:PRC-barrel domain-containing protein n=1 Tax=Clostridium sp. TaxID=1506 RepID=UPI002FCC9D11